ncbi:MAG: hypothetical protein AB7T14_03855, partial [Candidatus Methylacidiphilaceae bacterium]
WRGRVLVGGRRCLWVPLRGGRLLGNRTCLRRWGWGRIGAGLPCAIHGIGLRGCRSLLGWSGRVVLVRSGRLLVTLRGRRLLGNRTCLRRWGWGRIGAGLPCAIRGIGLRGCRSLLGWSGRVVLVRSGRLLVTLRGRRLLGNRTWLRRCGWGRIGAGLPCAIRGIGLGHRRRMPP